MSVRACVIDLIASLSHTQRTMHAIQSNKPGPSSLSLSVSKLFVLRPRELQYTAERGANLKASHAVTCAYHAAAATTTQLPYTHTKLPQQQHQLRQLQSAKNSQGVEPE